MTTPNGDRSPEVVRTKKELADTLATMRATTATTIALVPTLGALHDGHRALLRRAKELAGTVVVSIFVNPLQFGQNEDLDRYPRTTNADIALCAAEGVAVVFAPAVEEMYAASPQVTLNPGPAGAILEGASRPSHFAGVLTVVAKLFNLVRPDVAVFGQKDAQQLALIRQMVRDLDIGVRIEAIPTVREDDGLAMSSRNSYLSPAERATALALSKALAAGVAYAADGQDAVRAQARQTLDAAATADPPLRLDYLALVDPDTFTEVDADYHGQAVLAVAGYVGGTRLIDNLPVELGWRAG